MNATLIHQIINNINPIIYDAKECKELKNTLANNIVYNINELNEIIEYLNISDNLKSLLINLISLNYSFNIIHFLNVLHNRIIFFNVPEYLKNTFEYQPFKDEFMNQQFYKNNCARILNNENFKDITIIEYLSYLMFDDYYYKELTDNFLN